MKRISIGLVLVMAVIAQNGKNTGTTSEASESAWMWQGDCGGLSAATFTTDKGWHTASCEEIMQQLSDLRDWRQVSLVHRPNIAEMLAYAQYEQNFRISTADFKKAQDTCRKLLSDGYAHPGILLQCRSTVRGVVPYGLKLEGKRGEW